MQDGFSDLINSRNGKFKHEFVQSLDASGCRQDASHRIVLKLAMVVDEAFTARQK
jgi:hypothetical protein